MLREREVVVSIYKGLLTCRGVLDGIPVLALGRRSRAPDAISPPTCIYMKAMKTMPNEKKHAEKLSSHDQRRYPELPFLTFCIGTRVERSLFYPASESIGTNEIYPLSHDSRYRNPSSRRRHCPEISSTSFGMSIPQSTAPCHRWAGN